MPTVRLSRHCGVALGLIAALCLVAAASPSAARTESASAPVRVVQLDGFVAVAVEDLHLVGAVAAGNPNPAQQVLDVDATHGADLPKRLRIYAFAASLGGPAVLDAARTLTEQSGIPGPQLVLVDRHTTYSHNDPSAASPANAFLRHLTPFLHEIGG